MSKNDFAASLIKKYADGVMVGGQSILDEDVQIVPLSPALDTLIGGGVPEGSWINFSSKPGVGKTTTALHFAATCQRPEYGARDVYYLDIEGRLKKRNLKGIKGLNLDKFYAIRSTEDKILSGQDFLTIGEEILKNNKRIVLILDSYSSICHEKELLEGIGTSTRGAGGYQLLSGFCRQMSQVVPVMKHFVVGIIQMMANPSGYGAAMQEKGGNSIIYQADVFLRAKSMEPILNGTKQVGQTVTWQCIKAALHGGFTGAMAESHIKYGIGIDVIREIMTFAIDIGLITKSGSWFVCEYMQNHLDVLKVEKWDDDARKLCRFQGETKLYDQLDSHPVWYELLKKSISSIMLQ